VLGGSCLCLVANGRALQLSATPERANEAGEKSVWNLRVDRSQFQTGADPQSCCSSFRSGSSNRSCATATPPQAGVLGPPFRSSRSPKVVDAILRRPCSPLVSGFRRSPTNRLRSTVGGTGQQRWLHRVTIWRVSKRAPSKIVPVHSSSRVGNVGRCFRPRPTHPRSSHAPAADVSQQGTLG